MTQSKYTLELKTILADPNFNLFDFQYKFYEDSAKQDFETIFKDFYYYYEIGAETVFRFKHMLKTKLNLIYPYYVQLYQTELAAKEINFLLNKDLIETFERDLVSDNVLDSSQNSNSNTDSNYKESNLDNGMASVNLDTNNLTTVNNSVDNVSNENNLNSTGNTTSKEQTKLISQGNIGTTSGGQLVQAWRDILININQLIIDECRDLFMGVY